MQRCQKHHLQILFIVRFNIQKERLSKIIFLRSISSKSIYTPFLRHTHVKTLLIHGNLIKNDNLKSFADERWHSIVPWWGI